MDSNCCHRHKHSLAKVEKVLPPRVFGMGQAKEVAAPRPVIKRLPASCHPHARSPRPGLTCFCRSSDDQTQSERASTTSIVWELVATAQHPAHCHSQGRCQVCLSLHKIEANAHVALNKSGCAGRHPAPGQVRSEHGRLRVGDKSAQFGGGAVMHLVLL